MNRRHPLRLAAALLILAPIAASAEEPDAKARAIAEKVTTEGAGIFDTLDAQAIAATYDESAVLTFLKDENGSFDPDVRKGRREIEELYKELFKNPETIKSRNIVERAKLLSPKLLVIDGTFDLNTLKPDSIKIPFHQVRREKAGKWQILSMEIQSPPKN